MPEQENVSEEPKGTNEETSGAEGQTPDPLTELPEWAQKEITKTRGEAANYRTRLREAEARLTEAKTPEDIAAAVKEFQEENAKLTRELTLERLARKFELPDDLVKLVTGSNEREMTEAAELLAKYATKGESAGSVGTEGRGGLKPNDVIDAEMDPRKLAARYKR